jgi:hypothetical protein
MALDAWPVSRAHRVLLYPHVVAGSASVVAELLCRMAARIDVKLGPTLQAVAV